MSLSTLRTGEFKFHTLESLPLDLVLEVMSSLDCYKSLLTLITISSVCYNYFITSSDRTLARITQNILGLAWEDAIMVLKYQRYPHGASFITKDKFILRRSDVANVISNQLLFKETVKILADSLVPFPRAREAFEISRIMHVSYLSCHGFHNEAPKATTSFEYGDSLSVVLFYKMWSLDLAFQYDRISTFSTRNPLTEREMKCLNWYSRIVDGPSGILRRIRDTTERNGGGRIINIFYSCNNDDWIGGGFPVNNQLLLRKMFRHLKESICARSIEERGNLVIMQNTFLEGHHKGMCWRSDWEVQAGLRFWWVILPVELEKPFGRSGENGVYSA